MTGRLQLVVAALAVANADRTLDAIRVLRDRVVEQPGDARAHYLLGTLCCERGLPENPSLPDLSRAASAFESAAAHAQQSTDRVTAALLAGRMHERMDDASSAERWFRSVEGTEAC
mmetsp:Transcript_21801/g.58631  ORF Transcript_21801/g.58631 Transcript_21801/m.58631 type:complete len:116 (-) Transcript_21801:20-367(-)